MRNLNDSVFNRKESISIEKLKKNFRIFFNEL